MICCDGCGAWQHNDCMGLPNEYAPLDYLCEICEPNRHKKLLAAMDRGEKPWEEVARQREAAARAEKTTKKKKGGKKGNRKSTLKPSDLQAPATQERAQSPILNQDGAGSVGANGQKRKLDEPSNGVDGPQVGRTIDLQKYFADRCRSQKSLARTKLFLQLRPIRRMMSALPLRSAGPVS